MMTKWNRNIKNIFIKLQMGTNILANQVKTPIQLPPVGLADKIRNLLIFYFSCPWQRKYPVPTHVYTPPRVYPTTCIPQELKEGEEVDIEVSPPIWNIEEKDQQDNLQGVNRELGNPPDSSSPEGWVKEEVASQGYVLK